MGSDRSLRTMSTYRCPHCQAVVQRAHICTRCGAPQPMRHLRSLVIVIASALAIAAFSFATITLQNAGMHHRVDHDHTIGDWSGYEGDETGPPANVHPNVQSIFTTILSNPDAGIW